MSKRIVSFVLTIALFGAIFGAWSYRTDIYDNWRLRGYTPPAEIARLADVTTMNDKSRKLFYVYRPSLDDKAAFNTNCTNAEQTIVLGCYVQNDGIYLYNVTDERLAGVVEVTAAHELLHAAYDRLPADERARIDGLTAGFAETITDERFKQTVDNYRNKDPSVVPNELHSILATEFNDLPPELEAYYSKYFTNRKAIVAFADAYKQAFTAREAEVARFDKQLADLKSQIDQLNGSLESQQAGLKTQFEQLQSLRRSGNIAEYNRTVPIYNQAVVAYNNSVNRQRQLVSEYNSVVERRNMLAVEENELIEALDSRDTIETQ